MNEPYKNSSWTDNIKAACLVGYVALMCGAYFFSNDWAQTNFPLVFSFPILCGMSVWVSFCFILDIAQYHREGWNFQERNTRIPFGSEDGIYRAPAKRSMWLGYPLFLTVSWVLTIATAYPLFSV